MEALSMNRTLLNTLTSCVACGCRISVNSQGYPDHHCSPRFESTMAGVQRREQAPRVASPAWAQRLAYGMELLHEAGDKNGC
jgi:hypothetical protein